MILQGSMVSALNVKVLNLRGFWFELELKQVLMIFFFIFDTLVSMIFDV